MKRLVVIILLLVSLPGLYAQKASADSLLRQANALYDNGKYAEALDLYNRILQQGREAPQLYYNMGNAAYKLDRKGDAVYYYRKALRENPDYAPAKQNLTLVNRSLRDRFRPLPKSFFRKTVDGFTGLFDLRTWGLMSLGFVWLFVISLAVYLFARRSRTKRIFFGLAVLFVALWAVSYLSYSHAKALRSQTYAVIRESPVDRYVSPSLAAEKEPPLHQGAIVRVLARKEDWIRIQTPDGNTAWIPANSVLVIQ